MKNFVLLSITIFSFLFTNAQNSKGEIKGIIKDSSTTFENATILVYNISDSSVVDHTLSDNNGVFNIKNIPLGNYRLFITSVQFLSLVKDFNLTEQNSKINFGSLYVNKAKKEDVVTVIAQNPIRLAQDTVEFKADAFKTRPNAVVEDLLKKLPGVQVDKSGNITAHGQTITKVYVDGKPFFGDDPKMATKNLPANIVDKVQIVDKKSDQSQFTGFDDGTTEKVINITIKKDKKKGFFGKAMAGAGTAGRYEGNLSFNHFNNGTQLSVIGQLNNINQEGFSFQDIMDFNGNGGFGGGKNSDNGGGSGATISMTRGSGGSFGGMNISGLPSGLKTTEAGGINFSKALSKKINLSTSYFYNHSYTLDESHSNTQNFYVDTSSNNTNSQATYQKNWKANHRFNMDLDWNIDSANSVLFRPSITFIDKETNTNTTSNIVGNFKNPQRDVSQVKTSNSNQLNLSGTFLFKHKTSKKGRTFSLRLNGGKNQTDGDGTNYNNQIFYNPITTNRLIDQISNTENTGKTYNAKLSYTEPLSKTRLLELYTILGQNNNNSDKESFAKDANGNYSILDTTLSNIFENTFHNQQIGFNLQTKLKKYDYTLGLGVQKSNLESFNILKQITLKQTDIINLFPTARLNFNLGKSRRFTLNYRGSTNQPTVTQLQPVIDNTNPLAIRTGNPNLKQEFSNNLNAMFSKFNFITMKSMFAFLNFSKTNNKIIDSIANIGAGAQFKKPINANGAYNAMGNFSFGLPIKAIKTTNLNFGTSINYNKSVNSTDAVKYFGKNLSITQTIGINYSHKENWDIMISSMGSLNKTSYTLSNLATNQYYTYNNSIDISYTFPFNLTLQTDLDNNIYTGLSSGYNQTFNLWNASISKLFLKDKSLEVKLRAFDLLKENKSISRTVAETYIQDASSNVLQQYFMLSVKYNLNKFGGKGNKSFSMPKMPGMRNMGNMRISM